MGLSRDRRPFGEYKVQMIGLAGTLAGPRTLADMAKTVSSAVGDPLFLFGSHDRLVSSVAVCKGGASDLFNNAIHDRVDLYVTGEPGEWIKGAAEESGVAFMALGHHATERFGVMRLADELAAATDLTAEYVEVENPV